MNKREKFLQYANEIKKLGYNVYINKERIWNFGYIVNDNDEIGSFQLGDYGYGVRFSTIHKPSSGYGMGFCLDEWDECKDTFTKEIIDRIFVKYPNWARLQEVDNYGRYVSRESIQKYSAKEFINSQKDLIQI